MHTYHRNLRARPKATPPENKAFFWTMMVFWPLRPYFLEGLKQSTLRFPLSYIVLEEWNPTTCSKPSIQSQWPNKLYITREVSRRISGMLCQGCRCIKRIPWHVVQRRKNNWLHPQSLTWNLKMMVSKRNLLFQGLIFRFHVKFRGCNWLFISFSSNRW